MIKIDHASGSYPVSFASLEQVRDALANAYVVTDENVYEAHQPLFKDCPRGTVVPPGENSKSLNVYGSLLEKLADEGVRRDGTIAAVGGGVVGDLVGFVAATYMRGIKLIMVPTSLLAQVDSSVGGKVAIDLPQGKNLVGSFYAPAQVLLCRELLQTLPERQFTNGAAEIWKYGAIYDADLFSRLEKEPLSLASPDLNDVVERCVEIKAEVVSQDECETTGLRAILNFGHTIGHAVELLTFMKGMLHGEAISIGMVLEAELGERLGETEEGTATRLANGLRSQGLPTELPQGLESEKLIEAMARDKKATTDGIRLSLVERVGTCKLSPTAPRDEIDAVLRRHERD